MRFLRSTLAALTILTLMAGTALANTNTDPVTPDETVTATTDSSTTVDTTTDQSTSDETASDEATPPETAYEVKFEGTVVAVVPPTAEESGTITLLVGTKEVTIPFTADLVEGEITVGSYIELKGNNEAITKIEVASPEDDEDEERENNLKSTVVGVTPATEGQPATITLVIAGQSITFTAEELGIPDEGLELITVGASFKLEIKDGKTELKISGKLGEVKVEVKKDGTVETKVKPASEHHGKGHEISAEKKALAEQHKEAAKKRAEEAKEKAKQFKEAAKQKAEDAKRKAKEQKEAAKQKAKEHDRDKDDDDKDHRHEKKERVEERSSPSKGQEKSKRSR